MWAQLLMRGHSASPLGAMDDLPSLPALTSRSPELAQDLVRLGWSVRRLGALEDVDDHSLEVVALQVEEVYRRPVDLGELCDLVNVAASAANLAWEMEGRAPKAEHRGRSATSTYGKETGDEDQRSKEDGPEGSEGADPSGRQGQGGEMAHQVREEASSGSMLQNCKQNTI